MERAELKEAITVILTDNVNMRNCELLSKLDEMNLMDINLTFKEFLVLKEEVVDALKLKNQLMIDNVCNISNSYFKIIDPKRRIRYIHIKELFYASVLKENCRFLCDVLSVSFESNNTQLKTVSFRIDKPMTYHELLNNKNKIITKFSKQEYQELINLYNKITSELC